MQATIIGKKDYTSLRPSQFKQRHIVEVFCKVRMGYNNKSSFYHTAGPMASCLCYDNNDRTSDRGIPITDIAIVSWKFGDDVGAKRDLIVFYVSNSTFLKIWLLDLCSLCM